MIFLWSKTPLIAFMKLTSLVTFVQHILTKFYLLKLYGDKNCRYQGIKSLESSDLYDVFK